MAAELVLAAEAEQDVADAYDWYEGRRQGLGEEFLRRPDACLRGIVRNPEMNRAVFEEYRRALVRRFPYAVFYEHSIDRITVYCVFHTSRDPKKWRRRLP